MIKSVMRLYGSVRVSEDSDPAFHFDADSYPQIQLFTSMRTRIRILLLIKVIRICDHWPIYRPKRPVFLSLHASILTKKHKERPSHFWPPK